MANIAPPKNNSENSILYGFKFTSYKIFSAGSPSHTPAGIAAAATQRIKTLGSQFQKGNVSLSVWRRANINRILKECTPLAIAGTVSMYVGNIPKYMIDWYMTEEIQAIFGYLMMPAFCIVLLSRFVYQPMIRDIGLLWQKKEIKQLKKLIAGQSVFILCVAAAAIPAGVWLGALAVQ